MITRIEYEKMGNRVPFSHLESKECFFSNGVLYMRIFQQDLDAYHIKNVNAISVMNAGLTFFDDDELVYRANRTAKTKRNEMRGE